MERSFVLVLTVLTLVTATPHGYGVKGGASAKAEASAVAGAFGDLGPIPLSIPSGAAYTGSFSKSSASSFASSSASSSSSSYSFSGTGANGVAGIGTDMGCSSGTCPGVGAPGSSLNSANAVSSAQAKALSGAYSPCQGSNCNGSPTEKCTSGQCSTDTTLKGHNECSAGNCQQNTPSSQTESAIEGSSDKSGKQTQEGDFNDSNDFAVNLNPKPQSQSTLDLIRQYYNKEKPYDSESGCSNGKCAPAHSNQNKLNNNLSQQSVPATFLTVPKEKSPCTAFDCSSQDDGPQTGGLPSSYNVPLQSATNPPNTYYSSPTSTQATYPNAENSVAAAGPAGPCSSANCNYPSSSVGSAKIPNYHFGQHESINQGSCTPGQCDSPSSLNGKPVNNGAVSGVQLPNYSHGGIPSNVPSAQPGCKSPYCADLPSYSSLPKYQPDSGCSGAACSSTSQTGTQTKPTGTDNAPVYSGGFGGPAGFLEKIPGNSAYDHGHQQPTGGFGSNPTHGPIGTTKPDEFRPTSNHGPTHSPTFSSLSGSFGSSPIQGSFGTTKPVLNSNNHGSTQTSSNGGSTGAYNTGYNKPVPPSSQFSPSYTGSNGVTSASSTVPLESNTHSENTGVYKPTTSNSGSSPNYSGSIDGSAESSQVNSGSNSIHGTFGIAKPNTPPNSQSSSVYTSTLGEPTGLLGGSSSTYGSPGSLNTVGSGNCGSANCNGHLEANHGVTSYDKTSPSTSTSSQKIPVYTGGFGGPTGFLKPTGFSGSSNIPKVQSGSSPCANGYCGPQGTPPSSQGSSLTSAHNSAAASASANAVAYSGGFGGPPGVLKPYDDGKAHTPLHGNLARGHTSNIENTDSSLVNGKISQPGNSAPGTNAVAHAVASASATAGSYGGNNNYQNNNGASRGCNSGCSSNGDSAGNFELADGLTKNGVGAGSVASAKSITGANAYGVAGSFASSSASAHASAGSATKGGYGKK